MPARILVVEDSPTQAEALRAHLEAAGHDVTVAARGDAALEALETNRFDLLLSDIVMPGPVDGYELCRRIKTGPHRDLPVILLTTLSDPTDIVRGLECGADNFLTKPYEPEILLERIELLLANRRLRSRARLKTGVNILFGGREYVITAEREQILDLLMTSFEEAVRQNRQLREREEELTAARVELARYAGSLEGLLQAILDHAPAVIYVKDREGRYRFISRQFALLFGVSAEATVGKTAHDIFPRELADEYWANDRKVLEAGRALQFDEVGIHEDGPHTYLSVKFPLFDGAGRVDAVCGIATDITERQRAEEAARIRARAHEAVAALSQRALASPDLGALMQHAVRAVAGALDVEYAEVLELQPDGKALVLRSGVGWKDGYVGRATVGVGSDSHAGYTLTANEPVVVAPLGRETRFQVPELLRAHGVESGVSVVIHGQHRPFGVLGAHSTSRRTFTPEDVHFVQAVANVLAAAIQSDQSQQALHRAQRLEAVGRLAGGIAHDFNNLLTAMMGYSELVLNELAADDPMAQDVQEIRKAADRAAGLTRQLLAFSRKQLLQPTVLNLNDVVADMDKMLRRLIGEDIDLQTVLAPSLGSVLADRGQIEQVILNLVVNARDAMPEGGMLVLETVDLELDATYASQHIAVEPGRYVMLAVSDTGIGMNSETQARMFEPFFSTKEADKGTGLGLATVYGIVKQSGGSIWVYSELGHGTTFKIYLPRTQQEAGAVAIEKRAVPLRGTETVLLVEDEPGVRRLAERLLRRAGYDVLVAQNPGEALVLSERPAGAVHLLVTDVIMPHMSGFDLAARLKAVWPDLRVLFVSGYTDLAVSKHNLAGLDAPLLQKPFTAEALMTRVRETLDRPSRTPDGL